MVRCRGRMWPGPTRICVQTCSSINGLKSSSAAWRAMFSEFVINVMGFKLTHADADVYMRRNLRNGGTPYYEYLLVYVDDVLVISHAPEELMKQIRMANTVLQHTWELGYQRYS